MDTPEIAKKIVGTRQIFSGSVFSRKKRISPTEFDVIDWRYGSSFIMNLKTMERKHPVVEFLLKNENMKKSQWSKPFPVLEYVSDGKEGWKKVKPKSINQKENHPQRSP